MTSSVVGPRSSSKALPKAKLAPQKSHSHCLVVCCPSDPLQLSECSKTSTSEKYAQQIYEMHRKLQCLQLAGTGQQKGPSLLHNAWLHVAQPVLQKLNKLGLIRHIQLTSHQPPLLQASWQLFAGKIASTISRRQKMLSESWLNPQAWIFRYYLLIYFWPCWVFIDVWAFLQLPRARATF